jgi:hypothetical protein
LKLNDDKAAALPLIFTLPSGKPVNVKKAPMSELDLSRLSIMGASYFVAI